MPIVKIPITGGAYQNVDEVSLTDTSPVLMNAYINEAKSTVKRPGLNPSIFADLPFPVKGGYWWDAKQVLIAVCNGQIYSIDRQGTVTDITGDALTGKFRPTFADNGTTLVMADGGRMITWDGSSGTTAYMADGDAPTAVTHVAFHDQYIICNEVGTGRFHFSNVNAPTTWDALDFATSESRPDAVTALHVGWREVLFVGPESAEVWYDDGITPFSRMEGGYTDRGCSAPYSVVFVDNTWVWLDDTRRFIRLDGRTPKVVSTPFDKVLHNFTTVSDCTADLIEADGKNFVVFNFPTEGKTLVWNYALDDWSEWSWWNQEFGEHERWLGSCHVMAKGWGKHLIGDRRAGKVYEMSSGNYDDAGDVIRVIRRTGHLGFGGVYGRAVVSDMDWKTGFDMVIRCKKGVGNDSVEEPKMMVRWRNNGSSRWSNERQISLGKMGEYDLIGRIPGPLGRFRTRQFELSHTDASEFILVDAEMRVEF